MTIKVVVPVSGGKDSQASLKLALESYPPSEVLGLFCDTQFEHPLTYAHIDTMRELYRVRIERVTAGDVPSKVRKYQRFPGGGARFCTEELKMRPTRDFCRELAEKQGSLRRPNTSDEQRAAQADGGFEVWYGMRSAESSERSKRYNGKVCDEVYAPHEVFPGKYPKYLQKMGVMFRLCILDWSEEWVRNYVEEENLNPLYREGFDRVGCFPCLASGDASKERAFFFDDFGNEQYRTVKILMQETGKNIWTSKGGISRHENADRGCSLCSM